MGVCEAFSINLFFPFIRFFKDFSILILRFKYPNKGVSVAFSGSIFAVNNTLLLKRSDTSSQAPDSLSLGELALNVADGKLFYKNSTANAIIRS